MRYAQSAGPAAVVILVGLVAAVAAQVPVTREPRHRVVFETPEFRILDVRVPPGDTTLDHVHEHDIVTVTMTSDAATRTQTPGQPWGEVRPRRPAGDPSISEHTGKADRHLVQNVGDIPYQLFAVENLRKSWTSGAALSARGTTLAAESRAFRIYDVRLLSEQSQIFHLHAVPTIAVLISGRAMSAGEESKTDPSAPIGLKQLVETGEWVLVPAGMSHHLVRLGNADSRVVEIEVR
jgi:quercetin dioxygenase-like cupin family protein